MSEKMVEKKDDAEKSLHEQLLEKVYEAGEDAVGLAASMGMSLGELAGLLREPEVGAALGGLRLLADLQAQLIVSRYRTVAAAKLVELASCGESNEVTRKACVDLLKMEVVAGGIGGGGKEGEEVAGVAGVVVDAGVADRVLEVLGELGKEGDADG